MDQQTAVHNIIRHCHDENGFLVQLYAFNTFNQERYYDLIDSISAYRRLLNDADDINRRVVGCLFDLIQIVENALYFHSQNPYPIKSELEKLEQAHLEVWNIIHEMFPLPSASTRDDLDE
jgi:hypothetical protein